MKIVSAAAIAAQVRALREAAAGGPLPPSLLVPEGTRPSAEELSGMADSLEKLFKMPSPTEAEIEELLTTGEVVDTRGDS